MKNTIHIMPLAALAVTTFLFCFVNKNKGQFWAICGVPRAIVF
jgi:hypothetical protein